MAYLLSIVTSILYGVSDFIGGISAKKIHVVAVMLISQCVGVPVIALVMFFAGHTFPQPLQIGISVIAGLSMLTGVALLYYVMAQGAMLLIAPIASLSAAIPVIVGVIGGETLSGMNIVGIVVTLIGATLAAIVFDKSGKPLTLKVFLCALASVAGMSVYFSLMPYAGKSGGTALGSILVVRITATAAAALMLLAVIGKTKKRGEKSSWRGIAPIFLMGVFDSIASASYSVALQQGVASGIVTVISSVYPAVTVLMVMIFLRERGRWYQSTGIVLSLLGVALLAL